MSVHYNNVRSLFFSFSFLVSTANTAPTVQPLVRSNNNNNTRQPTIVQRRHQSPPRVQSPSPATTVPISHRAANPTTAEMMTAAEIIRYSKIYRTFIRDLLKLFFLNLELEIKPNSFFFCSFQ